MQEFITALFYLIGLYVYLHAYITCFDYYSIVSVKVKVLVALSHVRGLFATPWTVAHQVSLSLKFSRQEYWSG